MEERKSEFLRQKQEKKKNIYLLGGLLDSHISGEASDLTGDSLHAGLALKDRGVDVVDAFDQVVHGVHF